MTKKPFRDFSLYVICDNLAAVLPAIEGGADVIQLRKKGVSHRELFELALAFEKILADKETLFIVNDFADIAHLCNADGVHLGQDDLPVEAARRILGADKIIGLSTHSLQQARDAQSRGCDYIAVGPIFPTPTKPDYPAVGLELLRQVGREIGIPYVAIGGIDATNINEVLAAGATLVAVLRAVCGQNDVAGAARHLKSHLMDAQEKVNRQNDETDTQTDNDT